MGTLPVMRTFRPGGWPSAVAAGESPVELARQALSRAFAESLALTAVITTRRNRIEPIGFLARGMEVQLLYPVALPMAVGFGVRDGSPDPLLHPGNWPVICDTQPKFEAAQRMAGKAIPGSGQQRALYLMLLEHWHRRLDTGPAALDFLARYFTLSQMRDVYSAVWGYEQEQRNFAPNKDHKAQGHAGSTTSTDQGKALAQKDGMAGKNSWANDNFVQPGPSSGPSRAIKVATDQTPAINRLVLASLAQYGVSHAVLDPLGEALAKGGRWLGFSSATVTALGLLPGMIGHTATVVAGATTAFQYTTQGKGATWYQRTDAQHPNAKPWRVYGPRPTWRSTSGDPDPANPGG